MTASNDFSRSDAAQAAQAAAARINQQLGVGPPSSAPPPAVPKPSSHQGLGMVVTEEYAIPDKMVGLSKLWSFTPILIMKTKYC